MTINIATPPLVPSNLFVNWHPFMSRVPEFFSDHPKYSVPAVLSERQKLARRIHLNFDIIGCLFKSMENNPTNLTVTHIYNFVFSRTTTVIQQIHDVACSLINPTKCNFIMRVIENSPRIYEFTNEISKISSNERQGIMEYAMRILEECPSCRIKFLLNAIRQIPPEEREQVITITLSLLTNKKSITRPHTLINIIRRIPADERVEVLEMAIPIFSRPLHSDEVLDRIIETVHEIIDIPSNERAEVLELAAYLFNKNFSSGDDMERARIISQIYRTPSHERTEVVRLAEPLMDSRHFRTHSMPIDSEYAIYISSQEDIVLSAIRRMPSAEREQIISLARLYFREGMDNRTRASILERERNRRRTS